MVELHIQPTGEFMDPVGMDEIGQDPAPQQDLGWLFTKEVSGVTELFYEDDLGIVTQLTGGGSLVHSLDQAYDDGRIITVDNGPVQLDMVSGQGKALLLNVVASATQINAIEQVWTGTNSSGSVDRGIYFNLNSLSQSSFSGFIAERIQMDTGGYRGNNYMRYLSYRSVNSLESGSLFLDYTDIQFNSTTYSNAFLGYRTALTISNVNMIGGASFASYILNTSVVGIYQGISMSLSGSGSAESTTVPIIYKSSFAGIKTPSFFSDWPAQYRISSSFAGIETLSANNRLWATYQSKISGSQPSDGEWFGYLNEHKDITVLNNYYGFRTLMPQTVTSGNLYGFHMQHYSATVLPTGATERYLYLNADNLTVNAGATFYAIDLDMDGMTVGGTIAGIRVGVPAGIRAAELKGITTILKGAVIHADFDPNLDAIQFGDPTAPVTITKYGDFFMYDDAGLLFANFDSATPQITFGDSGNYLSVIQNYTAYIDKQYPLASGYFEYWHDDTYAYQSWHQQGIGPGGPGNIIFEALYGSDEVQMGTRISIPLGGWLLDGLYVSYDNALPSPQTMRFGIEPNPISGSPGQKEVKGEGPGVLLIYNGPTGNEILVQGQGTDAFDRSIILDPVNKLLEINCSLAGSKVYIYEGSFPKLYFYDGALGSANIDKYLGYNIAQVRFEFNDDLYVDGDISSLGTGNGIGISGDVGGNLTLGSHVADATIHSGGVSIQNFWWNTGVNVIGTGVTVYPTWGLNVTGENSATIMLAKGGTIKNLRAMASANSRADATTVTIRKNSIDTVLTVSIPAGSTVVVSDLVNTVVYADGDHLTVRVTTGAGAGTIGQINICVQEDM